MFTGLPNQLPVNAGYSSPSIREIAWDETKVCLIVEQRRPLDGCGVLSPKR
jgi:hypothetical protein